MQKKSIKIWIILLIAPLVVMTLTAIMQVIVRIALGGAGSDRLVTLINMISLFAGIFTLFGLLGTPLWIILLVKAIDHNKKVNANSAPNQNNTPVNQ